MFKDGALTERLRGGLQNLLNGFDSHTCLHTKKEGDNSERRPASRQTGTGAD